MCSFRTSLEYPADEFLEDAIQKADASESIHKFIYKKRYFLIKKIRDTQSLVS